MTDPTPSFSVNVDVINPGQFFACCGLLELSHRLWPGAEGWFDTSQSAFAISVKDSMATLDRLKDALSKCDISGLSDEERREREALEAEGRQMKKQSKRLSDDKDIRRKELGTLAREGVIRLGAPFGLLLNWWQTGEDEVATPKTWAGRQELQKVARAAQDGLANVTNSREMFDRGCVLRTDQNKPVEPFYFDARRFAHALDTGFSLDIQGAETVAHPAVELLALIGLQRFRPALTLNKWMFQYSVWSIPLSAPAASGVSCCAIPIGHRYIFRLLFRDDQKRYKAFDFATHLGDKREQ